MMPPRYALLYSILACMVAWQLAACAVAPERQIIVMVKNCDGVERPMRLTRIETVLPPYVCAKEVNDRGGEWWQAASHWLGPSVACAIWGNDLTWGVIVLPPSPWAWVEAHEMDHILNGYGHEWPGAKPRCPET